MIFNGTVISIIFSIVFESFNAKNVYSRRFFRQTKTKPSEYAPNAFDVPAIAEASNDPLPSNKYIIEVLNITSRQLIGIVINSVSLMALISITDTFSVALNTNMDDKYGNNIDEL